MSVNLCFYRSEYCFYRLIVSNFLITIVRYTGIITKQYFKTEEVFQNSTVSIKLKSLLGSGRPLIDIYIFKNILLES